MSITTQPHETVSTGEQTTDPVFERRSWNYGYLGRDENGHTHHYDRVEDRIVVVDGDRERIDDAVPQFQVHGDVIRVERLGECEGRDVSDWIAFVDQGPVGWAERPVSAVDQLQDVIAEGI